MMEKVVVVINEQSNGQPESLDGIRFQFHDDGSISAYAWSPDHFNDDLHAYCEDAEMHDGVEVLNVDEVLADIEQSDYPTYRIEVDIERLKYYQNIWLDMWINTD